MKKYLLLFLLIYFNAPSLPLGIEGVMNLPLSGGKASFTGGYILPITKSLSLRCEALCLSFLSRKPSLSFNTGFFPDLILFLPGKEFIPYFSNRFDLALDFPFSLSYLLLGLGGGGEFISPKSRLRPFIEILSTFYFIPHPPPGVKSISYAFTLKLGLRVR